MDGVINQYIRNLTELYELLCSTPSDIQEHLPTLRDHASDCLHVTEIGMRHGFSTVALMMANPEVLVSWDIDPNAIYEALQKFMLPMPGPDGQRELPIRSLVGNRPHFQPRVGDSLQFEIEPTDLLFIDTVHTYKHLSAELEKHGNKVRRYIICHDTETFGEVSDDGTRPGLKAALREFQDKTGLRWSCVHNSPRNNGLIVLERMPFEGAPYPLLFFRQTHPKNPPRED